MLKICSEDGFKIFGLILLLIALVLLSLIKSLSEFGFGNHTKIGKENIEGKTSLHARKYSQNVLSFSWDTTSILKIKGGCTLDTFILPWSYSTPMNILNKHKKSFKVPLLSNQPTMPHRAFWWRFQSLKWIWSRFLKKLTCKQHPSWYPNACLVMPFSLFPSSLNGPQQKKNSIFVILLIFK